MCGEKYQPWAVTAQTGGSPPHVRGKDANVALFNPAMGITPACAGKSTPRSGTSSRPRDHPRMCGEKAHARCAAASAEGSPPHMRGKGSGRRRCCSRFRITPAYAGKRSDLGCTGRSEQDHPRVCGEKRLKVVRVLVQRGSPPRMRGKVKQSLKAATSHGITPAYAGKRSILAVGCN